MWLACRRSIFCSDPLFATDSSTPHTFSVFKYFALALLCPRESWSPTSTAKPVGLAVGVAENLFCREHSVCTVHTAVYNPPHTIQSLRMHPAVAESSTTPTQYQPFRIILCHDSKAAQPSSTTHSCPSSPKSLHRILTHVIRTPNSASPAYSTQNKPVTVPSRYYIRPVSEIARLLYTRAPPCPRKSSCPQYIQSYHHPFAAATPWPVPCP